MAKVRAWCFTLNNYVEDDINLFRELSCKYLVCGREVGVAGTPHLQGYVYFENARHLQGVKSIHPRCHWESARGDAESNRVYCTKDGNYFETGVIPMSQKRKGDTEKHNWEQAYKLAKEGRFEEIEGEIRFRYYRTIKDIRKDYMSKPADLTELSNMWIYGPPGVGKSRVARRDNPGSYFKASNKWWDGYQNEDSVIIDDFELDGKCLGHYLKIWGDRYSFIAESKGGALHIRPKKIIITSNYSPEEVFCSDPVMLKAIQRRFVTTHFPYVLEFSDDEHEEPVERVQEEPSVPPSFEFNSDLFDELVEI